MLFSLSLSPSYPSPIPNLKNIIDKALLRGPTYSQDLFSTPDDKTKAQPRKGKKTILMFAPRVNTKLCSTKQAALLVRAAAPLLSASSTISSTATSSSSLLGLLHHQQQQHRAFSASPAARLRDFFPAKETAHIRVTPPAWPHPGYTEAEMLAVVPGHREPATWGDKVAWMLIRTSRWCMDRVTGMSREQKTDGKKPTTAVVAEKPLTEAQWVSELHDMRRKKRQR